MTPPLVLASGSAARAALLGAAGIGFERLPAEIDEGAVKTAMQARGAAVGDVALALAERKAEAVSRLRPRAIVIGADQMLALGGIWFDKPRDRTEARAQLLALRGRAHNLVSGMAAVRDGTILWRHQATATLQVRNFSEAFLDRYLDRAGAAVLASVGAYQLEGLGAQLFSSVEGDYFTVLGLPLLPLLEFLRGQGLVPT